jgi:hypothetical protein
VTSDTIRTTRAARTELRRIARPHHGVVRLGRDDVDAAVRLSVVPEVASGDLVVEADGVTVAVDPSIVAGAGKLVLDVSRRGFYLR